MTAYLPKPYNMQHLQTMFQIHNRRYIQNIKKSRTLPLIVFTDIYQ